MGRRKALFVLLALAVLTLVLLFPFQTRNSVIEKSLVDAVTAGEFTKAHEILDDKGLDQGKRYLYNAALLTLSYQPKLSNECIENLELLYGKTPIEADIQEQLTLLKISNAFIEGNLPHFFSLCKSSSNLLNNSLYKEFVSAIVCLKNGDYTGAKNQFSQSKISSNGTLASIAFITIFKDTVIGEFQLRIALDQGNLIEAKQETYSLAKLQLDSAGVERIYLLIMKKSDLGQEAVVSLIKPIAEKNGAALQAIFQKNFADSLAQGDYKKAAFLLSIMSSIEEKNHLEQAFEPLIKMASSERRQAILAICEESVTEKKAHQFLSYGAMIANTVDSHDEANSYIDILKQSVPEDKDIHLTKLRKEAEAALLVKTRDNNISIEILQEKLEFYKKLQPEPQELDVLCYKIVQNTFSYPLPECGDTMIAYWQLLLKEPLGNDCKKNIKNLIQQFILKKDVELPSNSDSIQTLVFLERAEKVIQGAQVADKIKHNALTYRNLLLSSLERGNYVQAAQVYPLLMAAAPDDSATKYIKALLEYVQGNQAAIISYLERESPQSVLNGSIKKIEKLLSATFAERESLLSTFIEREKVDPVLLFSLGMIELYLGRVELAKIALLPCANTSVYAKALLCYIAFAQKKYSENLDLAAQLPVDIRSSHPIRAMELLSLIQLGKKQESILLVKQCLAEIKEKNSSITWINSLRPEWRMFWLQDKENYQLSFAIGTFYSKIEENHRQALLWFAQVENPSFLTRLEEVRIASHVSQFTCAESILRSLESSLAEEPYGVERDLRKLSVDLAWANIFILEGKEVVAEAFLRSLVEKYPDSDAVTKLFAKLYCRELRYDLALHIYKDFQDKPVTSDQDKLGHLIALVHSNYFDKSITLAKQLERSYTLSSTERLQLCKNMIYAGVPSFAEEYNTLPLTTTASIEYMDLLRIQGKYQEALALFENNKDEFEKQPVALYQKALILESMSERQHALKIAKEAYELSPEDRDICTFLDSHEIDSHWIEKRLHSLMSQIDGVAAQSLSNLIPVIYDATALLLRIAEEKLVLTSISQSDCRSMLITCRDFLQKLSSSYAYLPRVLYYYAKAEIALGSVVEAKNYLMIAHKLSPSYSNVTSALGIIAMNNKKYSSAKSYFEQAITFDPCNASLWMLLATVDQKNDDLMGSKRAIEQAHKFRPNDSPSYVQTEISR